MLDEQTHSNSNFISYPGRVRTYLDKPHANTLPYSCILRKYHKNKLGELLETIAVDLKHGAGVKTVLDEFTPIEYPEKRPPFFRFYLSPKHFDAQYLSNRSDLYNLYFVSSVKDSFVYRVRDQMEGNGGIIDSWKFLIELYNQSQTFNVVFDLSNLRPAGSVNSNGMIASGPVSDGKGLSFVDIYFAIDHHMRNGKIGSLIRLLGVVNEVIRRGGFKRGIVCTSLHYQSASIYDYINQPNKDVVGGHRKSYRIDKGLLDYPELLEQIADSVENEGSFLEKEQTGFYANVCMGIKLKEDGTCLLNRINLAQLTIGEFPLLPEIFEKATLDLLTIHCEWRDKYPEKSKRVAKLDSDNQVALDLIGLASAIAQWGITYKELCEALKRFNNETNEPRVSIADNWVYWMARGYQKSKQVADEFSRGHSLPYFERLHTIEPSQRHFLDLTDREGYTVTRSVYPPFDRRITRVSDTEDVVFVEHNPKVETVQDVGADLWQEFFCELKTFLGLVGRSHGFMSFDSYKPITPEWIKWFLESSPLESLYYPESSRYETHYLDKKVEICDLGLDDLEDCSVCSE